MGGTNFNFYIAKQLPAPKPQELSHLFCGTTYMDFIVPRVLELTYTSWELESFAYDLGYFGPPFKWDDERRFLIRCELDAALFHLYFKPNDDGSWRRALKADGHPHDETPEEFEDLLSHFPTPREAIDYIMETFPIVKSNDEKAHDEYRTKRTITEIYDAIIKATQAKSAYQTPLDPPPGPPLDAQGNFAVPAEDSLTPHIHPSNSAG